MNPKITLRLEVFSGFHDPDLDSKFLSVFQLEWNQSSLSQTINLEVRLSKIHETLYPALGDRVSLSEEQNDFNIFLGFSAGVVRAAFAAQQSHSKGNKVAGLIAMDGWGMPLINPTIPTYRFSHDLFTHLSSSVLGGEKIFFADPPVPHLSLWSQLDQIQGWYHPPLHPSMDAAMEMTASQALVLTIQALSEKALDSKFLNAS